MHKLMASIAALAACLGGSSAAMAGTATAASKATLTVVNQCSIAGANVNLGTYRSTDTLRVVGNQIGYQDVDYNIRQGSTAIASVNLGSVNCSNGTIYTIAFLGNGPNDVITLDLANGQIYLHAMIKKIGEYVVPDGETYFNGFGKTANPNINQIYTNRDPLGTTANGQSQMIMGNVIASYLYAGKAPYIGVDQQLGSVGTYSAPWTSQINF